MSGIRSQNVAAAVGGAPSGSAGGGLAGTYPNPTILALNSTETQYTPTFTGFGTVTVQSFWWSRIGPYLVIRGSFTSGTSTAAEARISLPQTSSANIVTSGSVGWWTSLASLGTNNITTHVLIEPSKAYVCLGWQSSVVSANGVTKQNGSAIISAAGTISLIAFIPIDTWV